MLPRILPSSIYLSFHPPLSPCICPSNHHSFPPSLHSGIYSSILLSSIFPTSLLSTFHLYVYSSNHPSTIYLSYLSETFCAGTGDTTLIKRLCLLLRNSVPWERQQMHKLILIIPRCASLRRVVASGVKGKEIGSGMRIKWASYVSVTFCFFKKYLTRIWQYFSHLFI